MKSISLRFLYDSGLLFEINRQVLHPIGMALAVSWDGDNTDGEPCGVVLYKTDDPDGVVFSPETFREGEGKYRQFIDSLGGHKLAERFAILGFTIQADPGQGGPETN